MAYTSVWIDERPQILAIVNRVKEQFPAAWNELKIPGQESRQFINRVSIALIEAGIPGGVNLKRGGPQQSIDALAFPNPTGARDASGTYKGVEIIDIVNGAEGSNPSIGWGDVTQVTMDSGNPGGWKAGSLSGETPGVHLPSYAELGDDVFFRAMIGVPLFADYLMANQSPNDGMSVWFSRAIYRLMAAFINANGKPVDAAGEVKIVRNEWRGLLGLPPL
jgi:hypothetical protein